MGKSVPGSFQEKVKRLKNRCPPGQRRPISVLIKDGQCLQWERSPLRIPWNPLFTPPFPRRQDEGCPVRVKKRNGTTRVYHLNVGGGGD